MYAEGNDAAYAFTSRWDNCQGLRRSGGKFWSFFDCVLFLFLFFFLFLDVINDIVSWTFFLSIWSGVLLSALNLKICQEQNKQIVKKCRYLRPGIADPESENPKILE